MFRNILTFKKWQSLSSNNKQIIVITCLLLLVLGFFYLSCLPIITPDSTDYYIISRVIKGDLPFHYWWELRGPILPLIIFLITSIFGDNPVGFLIGTFLFYLISAGLIIIITKRLVGLFNDRLVKLIIILSVVFLIIFNPITIGYYHAMLTEFVATFLAITVTALSIKWMSYRPSKNSIVRLILYPIVFGLLFVTAWLLKQPYLTLAALPMVIAGFISLFRIGGYKNLAYRVFSLAFCALVLIVVSALWSNFLCSKRECFAASTPNSYFSQGLINGASSFMLVDYNDVVARFGISQNEYTDPGDFDFYIIHDYRNGETDYIAIEKVDMGVEQGYLGSLRVLSKFATKHPWPFLRSYFYNYLATIDFINFKITNKGQWIPLATSVLRAGENYNLSYTAFQDRNIYWWPEGERPFDELSSYEISRKNNVIVKLTHSFIGGPHQILFIMTFLFLPVMFLVSSVRFLRNRRYKYYKSKNKSIILNDIILLLSGLGFLHVMSNVLTGAIIDRYISVVYPLVLLATILFVASYLKKKDGVGLLAKKQTNGKLLFVIPAYNEAENIGAVLKDIKKNMPVADIVVVNDCSSDNTKQIVEAMGVVCLDMPFNVRYAMAVQAGLKYAGDNDYGYVIQFDADGQHLASEAKKLLLEAKKTGVDIVIGSRFLAKTNYKHPLARVIGTKVNSAIVDMICGQKIADPTSGLQCLNRRVIERYARIGGYPEYPDANLIVEMLLAGYSIKEIPVVMKARETGESMHSGVIKPIKYAIKITYSIFVITLRNLEIRRKK